HELTRDDVQQVVVGKFGTKTARGLEVAERVDDLVRGGVAVREHQEVAGAERQPAAMRQEVADRELTRDPRVVHPELGQVVDYPVFPVKLPLVGENGERSRGEGLRDRADLEQRA